MRKIAYLFFSTIFLVTSFARADFSFDPRIDEIGGSTVLSSRLVTNAKLSSEAGPFHLFIEGFAEFETQRVEAELRNINQGAGYLQEGYLEFKLGSFFLKAGRQSYRWSEMWTVPSLDIWTGRRFNRLFYDPFSEQLSHPLGMTASYVQDSWSIDGALISEIGETTYPYPLSLNKTINQKNDLTSPEGGLRLKSNLNSLGYSALVAQIDKKTIYGMTANYAFEKVVPKIELGLRQDSSDSISPERKNDSLVSIGCDVFTENWTFTPQMTAYDYGDVTQTKSYWQSLAYINTQWNKDRHEFQAQGFYNFQSKDSFASISYGYHLKEFMTLSGFLQNYDGQDGTLFGVYKTITGGALIGIRAQFFSSFSF